MDSVARPQLARDHPTVPRAPSRPITLATRLTGVGGAVLVALENADRTPAMRRRLWGLEVSSPSSPRALPVHTFRTRRSAFVGAQDRSHAPACEGPDGYSRCGAAWFTYSRR